MTKKEEYKKFYMFLIDSGVIEKPFDEDSFDGYIFDNYESEALNIDSVDSRRGLLVCPSCGSHDNWTHYVELKPPCA